MMRLRISAQAATQAPTRLGRALLSRWLAKLSIESIPITLWDLPEPEVRRRRGRGTAE
jgi:hypothetical protein